MRTLHMRGIKKILHLSASTTLSLVWLVSAGFCGIVDEAQTLLNRLSYNAGVLMAFMVRKRIARLRISTSI